MTLIFVFLQTKSCQNQISVIPTDSADDFVILLNDVDTNWHDCATDTSLYQTLNKATPWIATSAKVLKLHFVK